MVLRTWAKQKTSTPLPPVEKATGKRTWVKKALEMSGGKIDYSSERILMTVGKIDLPLTEAEKNRLQATKVSSVLSTKPFHQKPTL